MNDLSAYNDLCGVARRTPRAMPPIIVSWGRDGEQYAATRVARGGSIQMRRWMTPGLRWAKWRKLLGGDVLRLATAEDAATFRPDYGPAWERE